MSCTRSSPVGPQPPPPSMRGATSPTDMPSNNFPPLRPTFKSSLANVPVPAKLLEGVSVVKVGTSGKTKKSFLTVSADRFTVYITTSKVKRGKIGSLKRVISGNGGDGQSERAIDIGSIDRIQKGQITHKFELARKSISIGSPRRSRCMPLDPNRCFSIMFRGERTLDLMTEEFDNRDEILDILNKILEVYQSAKSQVGNDVALLRYIWIDVDKVSLCFRQKPACV
mmetsp:Transcript_16305/g.24168  ORF Transcript_16305/g.24168 Transcript_16305/m.24168 type:complete len:226 (-) Transcript_16305:2389-3066(-)